MMGFQRTTAINKIVRMIARKKVVQGGTSASKTWAILSILIDRALKEPNLEISVIACTIAHLKTGAMKDFVKIMKLTKRFNSDQWNKTDRKYSFSNGSYIEFHNANEDKATGARRNILYINEANKDVSYETYIQLAARTDQDIYIDFNPARTFWAHTEVLEEPDSELLILTYRDNEAIGKTIKEDLLAKWEKAKTSDYWKNWCKVYIDGEIGLLEGTIFQNWKKIDSLPKKKIDSLPEEPEAKLIGYGLDFGFTNDPTALVAVYKYDGKIILDELIYKKGLLNSDVNNLMKQLGIDKSKTIWADSAAPQTIAELKSYGYHVRPTKKGPDSIKQGIYLMQEYDYLITSHSYNIINEFERYCWLEKGDTNVPADAWNHAVDAIRYCVWMSLGNKQSDTGGLGVHQFSF